MMVVGNGYHPFRNAGTAFPRTALSMMVVGADIIRPVAVIFRNAVPFPPGAYFFCLSGLALCLPAALCLRQGKCLPSHFGRLTPPPAALPHGPKEVCKKTTHRGGAKTLLPQRHAPSPMYPSRTARLQLRYWVALPAHAPFGRGNGRGAPCPTARPDRLTILGGGGSIRGRAAL